MTDVETRIAALKAEAQALRAAGNKLLAVQKVREIKALKERSEAATKEAGAASNAGVDSYSSTAPSSTPPAEESVPTVAARLAALKAEAQALRDAEDKIGALQKVRELKALRGTVMAHAEETPVQAAAAKAAEVPGATAVAEEVATAKAAEEMTRAKDAAAAEAAVAAAAAAAASAAAAAAAAKAEATVKEEAAKAKAQEAEETARTRAVAEAAAAAAAAAQEVIQVAAVEARSASAYEPFAPLTSDDGWSTDDDRSTCGCRSFSHETLDILARRSTADAGHVEDVGEAYSDAYSPLACQGSSDAPGLAGVAIARRELESPDAVEKVNKVREAIADLYSHVAHKLEARAEGSEEIGEMEPAATDVAQPLVDGAGASALTPSSSAHELGHDDSAEQEEYTPFTPFTHFAPSTPSSAASPLDTSTVRPLPLDPSPLKSTPLGTSRAATTAAVDVVPIPDSGTSTGPGTGVRAAREGAGERSLADGWKEEWKEEWAPAGEGRRHAEAGHQDGEASEDEDGGASQQHGGAASPTPAPPAQPPPERLPEPGLGEAATISGAEAERFFARIKTADPSNGTCVDCGAHRPLWASLSFGSYVCLECFGVHRSLGVHISFVRSLTMDSWSQVQRAKMERGGNTALNTYIERCGMPSSYHREGVTIIRDKYNTAAAAAYQERLADEHEELSSLELVPWEIFGREAAPAVARKKMAGFGSDTSADGNGDDEGDGGDEGGEGRPNWLLILALVMAALAIAVVPIIRSMMQQQLESG